MWTTNNNNELLEWIRQNHSDKEQVILDWFNGGVTPCEKNEGTGNDIHFL